MAMLYPLLTAYVSNRNFFRLRRLVGLGLAYWCCLELAGCAVVAGYGVDNAYAAAFRTTVVDPSKLTDEQRERLKNLQIVSNAMASGYTSQGPVKGFACKLLGLSGWQWRPVLSAFNGATPEDAALMQLKTKAVQMGANAVIQPTCRHGDAWDWGNDCFDTWTCVGEAAVLP